MRIGRMVTIEITKLCWSSSAQLTTRREASCLIHNDKETSAIGRYQLKVSRVKMASVVNTLGKVVGEKAWKFQRGHDGRGTFLTSISHPRP